MNAANLLRYTKSALWLLLALHLPVQNAVAAATVIADQPPVVTNNVPPNMMLALSVEWPTAVVGAYKGTYDETYKYVGYFDPTFCYDYYKDNGATVYNTPANPLSGSRTLAAAGGTYDAAGKLVTPGEYFKPVALASSHRCTGASAGHFSGNFLNWATMHAIDGFRFAMTGGDRYADFSDKTVVEKSRHSGQGGDAQFPVKDGSSVKSTATPFGSNDWSNLYARVHDGNSELNPFNDVNTRGRVVQISNQNGFPALNTSNGHNDRTYTYLVRVQVCDQTNSNAALRFEYNSDPTDFNSCQGYPVASASPTVYKPIGLIQKNAEKMRFGVTSYLLDSSQDRAGGVLRARMKSVGPNLVVPNGPAIPNSSATSGLTTFAEWDATTGIYAANPDSTDATASNVTHSGVINYLNKFGKFSTSDFKSYDPFGELYYAALRSLRNQPPVPVYVSGLTTAMYDGFPVITTTVTEPTAPFTPTKLAPLPIQYYCQQNNIVGIADSNCHTDVDVPGNTLVGYTGPDHPYSGLTDLDTVHTTNNIDVTALGNAIGAIEFNPAISLGTTYQSSGRKNTYHLAALAYWANTKDILPDDASKPWTKGPTAAASKQQVKSYFVDVRESGSDGPNNNQMWLAAKYGGFNDTNNNGIPASVATWHTNTDVMTAHSNTNSSTSTSTAVHNGYRPNNYFTGDSPEVLFESLSSIFNAALSNNLTQTAASLSTVDFSSSSADGAYKVNFNSEYWGGDVVGNQITIDNSGTPTATVMWNAQAKLNDQIANSGANNGWSSIRKIVTYNAGGVPFLWSNLSTAQKGYLQNQSSMLDYLRGKQCHEVGNTLTTGCTDSPAHQDLYRPRVEKDGTTHVLGDIVDSGAAVVGAPEGPYKNLNGYLAFVTKYKTTTPRKRVLYVGANDGMMHAFDADVGAPATTSPVVAAIAPGATAGQELWAYVPSFVLPGPTLSGASPYTPTPTVDGLAARTLATNFVHKYYVDQTPFIRDIDFDETKGVTTTCANKSTTGCNWRSILVGGLGKGGRGYYAIDVTQPTDWTSESAIATKVLWEFADEDMGFSFGRPVIVRTARDGWVVILSSGYNNIYGSDSTHRGKGFLYILNAKTGALIEKIATSSGSATDPSGFAHPAAFIPDQTTFLTDYVYGGDLNGNLWRFDLRGTPSTYSAPTAIATLLDNATTPVGQPITIEPKIEIGQNGIDRWVFIGTGKLLTLSDMDSTQQQTFYAIRDGSLSQAYGTATGQAALPASVGSFPVTRSMLVQHNNLLTAVIKNNATPMGWYYDLHTPLTGGSEKITKSIAANEGLIAWLGDTPSTEACSPGVSSNVYVTDYDTGLSRITVNNVLQAYFSSTVEITGIQFFKDENGKIRLGSTKATASSGPMDPIEGQFGRAAGAPVRVNWREIQQ